MDRGDPCFQIVSQKRILENVMKDNEGLPGRRTGCVRTLVKDVMLCGHHTMYRELFRQKCWRIIGILGGLRSLIIKKH